MFDHVQIKVEDIKKSRPFYEAVLATLGYKVVFEYEDTVVGFGTNPHDMFEISQAGEDLSLNASTHIALRAHSEDEVKKFHETAISLGAKDNGAPGPRDYEEGYYAAFVIDPNGHNLEAIYQQRP